MTSEASANQAWLCFDDAGNHSGWGGYAYPGSLSGPFSDWDGVGDYGVSASAFNGNAPGTISCLEFQSTAGDASSCTGGAATLAGCLASVAYANALDQTVVTFEMCDGTCPLPPQPQYSTTTISVDKAPDVYFYAIGIFFMAMFFIITVLQL